MLHRLWNDEAGYVISAELVLVGVLLVLGMIVGLSTLRDQITAEMVDVAAAAGSLNQSYSFAPFTAAGISIAGSSFDDTPDFCQETIALCVDYTVTATNEL